MQHLAWAQRDLAYLESMAEITPMYNTEACDRIRANLQAGQPHLRRSAISTFVLYLIEEDKHFCVIPKHPVYKEQDRIRSTLVEQIESLSSKAFLSSTTRYHRLFGCVKAWKKEKGFGFIRQGNGDKDAFLHIRDVLNAKDAVVPEGASVEYEVLTGPQGPRAVSVIILQ
jgi:cold shock CspA family protein